MNAFLSTDFVMSYPPSVFTEPNMMLVRLIGATSLRDSKCSDLLAQWMSSSPLIRARFTEAMDHAPLPAVQKTKVQAIRTYAEALFPAAYLIGLLLELGAPRSGLRLLSEYITWCDSWVPAEVLLGGDQPWLRRLLGISVAPQVGSIFNEAVRDNTAKQWNGIAARRTTRSDANNHRRYLKTRKSLDAAGCTGDPLLVIARNRVFLCILHCCMAFGRLFVAFLEAQVGNHPPEVAGEVMKILYRNRCGVRLGAHNAPDGEEAHNLF